MKQRNRKLYWLPPKGFRAFFHLSSDEEFKSRHPIGYWFIVALGCAALLAPMILYGMFRHSPNVGLAGIAGTFIIGIGLFNFVSILLHQYLGHLLSLLSFLLGAILIAVDMGLWVLFVI